MASPVRLGCGQRQPSRVPGVFDDAVPGELATRIVFGGSRLWVGPFRGLAAGGDVRLGGGKVGSDRAQHVLVGRPALDPPGIGVNDRESVTA